MNIEEKNFLMNLIKQLKLEINEKNKIDEIQINLNMLRSINNYFKSKISEPTEKEIFVYNQLKQSQTRESLSCRKIAKAYLREKGIPISKTYVNYVIRNKLNFHYSKTTIKNTQIIKDKGIMMSFFLLK